MRIITGTAKGKLLKVAKTGATRPTKDMVRQAVFSILDDLIIDANVCDICAGSGSYGLESLSRGANRATFIESDKEAYKLLNENVINCGFQEKSDLYHRRIEQFLKREDDQVFDIIFFDPPFRMEKLYMLVPRLKKMLKKGGLLIVESEKPLNKAYYEGIFESDVRRYGGSYVTILENFT